MARPQKKGMEYFPFDVGFFDDRKIKELKGKFGSDGITVYIYLLCLIYKENGYYIQLDDGFNYVASADLNMDSEKIGQIINFLCKRSLFDDTLFTSDKVLTSHGIQLRFQEAVKMRASKKEIEVIKKFWVLDKNETQGYIKYTDFQSFSEKNPSLSEKNPSLSEKNSIKESKVKESKVKESSIGSRSRALTPCQKIVEMFNRICVSFPRIENISDSRKKAIKARLNKYTENDFEKLFTKAEASSFLKGGNNRDWFATFDWLIKDANMAKTLDGNYDDRGKQDVFCPTEDYDAIAWERQKGEKQ